MDMKQIIFLFITCIVAYCNSQTYTQGYRYPAQRRAGYSYTPTSYNRGAVSTVSNNRNSYSTATKPYYQTNSNAYRYSTTQRPSTAVKGYSSAAKDTRYNSYNSRAYSTQTATSANNPVRWYASSDDYKRNNYITTPADESATTQQDTRSSTNTKDNLRNTYNSATSNSQDTRRNPATIPDAENAKFAGTDNQEKDDESSPRTALYLKRRKFLRQRLAAASALRNRCLAYGRDAQAEKTITPPPREQGRFLFDVNVYKVYPQGPVAAPLGCGGYGGGFGGGLFGDDLGYGGGGAGLGGALADPLLDPVYPATPVLNQILGAWAPGILNNALAVTARPLADPLPPPTNSDQDLQNDPDVDPDYQRPVPIRRPRPNRVYYDSAGAAPLTPAQLVGGVATTVNGIIQQLTGNVQPVYQSAYTRSNGSYRSNRYG
ncbi:uncharacterized protein LOC133322220 [Musca vetustissima]|uniref:uncharacterized protein LOC133322220 n=1 Tax=Musca vetustissima TaxID=27455 RepID=UPI002AB77549|nr:uncharacterized protein LOC133322220 [Musca vetustissima]